MSANTSRMAMESTPREALPVIDVVVATRNVPGCSRSCRKCRRSRSTRWRGPWG